ncbi:MAG: UDP-N-acetylmuramate--L-alanine ligase [Candidatus Dadabacteria bacterium]|nr:MAG: UDP-N-acetylmuramate--L-alanine ligase [Candidatus Dadabacteria bacterium]
MKLGRVHRVHFVGIGGTGMNGLAQILLDLGYAVSGSDVREGDVIACLRAGGARIAIGHAAENVADADVVVRSTAIPDDNPELTEAERLRVPVIHRAEMLAELMRLKPGVAVAGAHGKTTTTSLIAHVLETCGLDPTVVIGGRVKSLGGHGKLGQGELVVVEADESDGSFLRLRPVIAVINNIDREHLEYWGSFDALKDGVVEFANAVPFYGTVLLGQDDPELAALRPLIRRPVRTFAIDAPADLQARKVDVGDGTRFELTVDGEPVGQVVLPLAGRHNVRNALAAIGVAIEAGASVRDAAAALASFPGVERRFEVLSDRGPIVVDDYGHHPAEIRATLDAARHRWQQPVTAVFQPHRFSRLADLWDDFRSVLLRPDRVVVTDVYAAGERPRTGVDGARFAAALQQAGHPDATWVAADELVRHLGQVCTSGDVVLFLGAGDITRRAHEFAETLA